MIPRDLASEILETLLSRGGDFAEVFVESLRTTSLGYEDGRMDEAVSGTDLGAGLRLVHEGLTYFANGNDVSAKGLRQLASTLASALPDGLARRTPAPLEEIEVPVVSPVREEPARVPFDRKVQALVRADRAARAFDPRIVQVTVRYRETDRSVLVASSRGAVARDRTVYTTLVCQAVAREGDHTRSSHKVAAGTCGFELLEQQDPEPLAREAARVACQQLTAEPAPAGTFTVVLSSKAGGTMIHEACGHGLEADFIEKGLSVYAGRLGQKVASDLINVVDDGTLPGRRGSSGMDDEGTPSRRAVLIENGVLKGYLHSLRTARVLGHEATGHGRRESYRHLPIPRMRNTMILPGRDDPEAIIASVADGILVTEMGGGEVDIVSGNFVFHCTEAYRIRGGKVAEPLRDAILTGNGLEVLSSIDRVGSDLGFQVGTCGKDGQGVPVADAQPTLRIPSIVVGGQAR